MSSTYFTQGLPYMIVRILSAVYFTDVGAKERYLGYLNFLGIPWNMKFLWAPLVDAIGTKRRWLVAVQVAISISILTVAATCAAASTAEGTGASWFLLAIAALFVGMAFIAATNDIVIDGFYLQGITDKSEQAAYSGYRVMAYRAAMVFARSGLVALAAWAAASLGGESKHLPWAYAFGAGGLTMLALAVFHGRYLPRFEDGQAKRGPAETREVLRSYARAFGTYLKQDRVALVLAFIITYRLGDEIMFSMVTPFLLRELAITKGQLSWIAGIVGAAGSVAGAMVGGYWIKKKGLRRAIWPLTLLMNLNIWAYVWMAYMKPDPTTTPGIVAIALVHGYEQVAAGLGSAALLVYLLRTCKAEFAAAHYAIGSAIMSLGATLVGGFGGRIVEQVGYVNLFILAFCGSVPSMILIPWVPFHEEEK